MFARRFGCIVLTAVLMLCVTGCSKKECQRTLSTERTYGAKGCFIDEKVTKNPGKLTYTCDGGTAKATFGDLTFSGDVSSSGSLTLTLETEFPYSDGCRWGTLQTISGNLNGQKLMFSYKEAPLPGQRRCANPCQASAAITMSNTD